MNTQHSVDSSECACDRGTAQIPYRRLTGFDRAKNAPVYDQPVTLCLPCYRQAVRKEIAENINKGET